MAHPPAEKKKAIRILARNQGDIPKTSVETGIPKRTLSRWKNSDEFVEALDGAIAAYLERGMEDDAIRTTSGFYAMQTVQQLVKTKQLLTGGPTDRLHMTGDLASFLSQQPNGTKTESGSNPARNGLPDLKSGTAPLEAGTAPIRTADRTN